MQADRRKNSRKDGGQSDFTVSIGALPFFAKKTTLAKRYMAIVAIFIVIIEVVQLVTLSGSLNIDDFILNFAGALIGFFIFTRISIRSIFKLRAW